MCRHARTIARHYALINHCPMKLLLLKLFSWLYLINTFTTLSFVCHLICTTFLGDQSTLHQHFT